MFASIVIVILGIVFGSLSILTQYTKNRERRKRIEGALSIPAVLALFGTISWLMSNAHHLDDLGVSPITLMMALAFFVLIPAVTWADEMRHKLGNIVVFETYRICSALGKHLRTARISTIVGQS
ncbi:MAG: hypothetical protein NTW69_01965 [Chloroflexi bacterium]|nr:hypothetical protein [Chloroflexota bacterium]